jgi:hypothetical protein
MRPGSASDLSGGDTGSTTTASTDATNSRDTAPTATGRATLDDVVRELKRTRESIESDNDGGVTLRDLLQEFRRAREAIEADAPRPTQRNDPRYREARR